MPHVYGSARAGTMFGAGYVAAQDRRFVIDVLRHAGRAQMSGFVGGAKANRVMDAEQWSLAPYDEADFQHQYDLGEQIYGSKGAALKQDASDYVAGINRYISEARLDPSKMLGEYAGIGRPQGPDDWRVTDLFATASLVGGIFGKGGGTELAQVELLRAFTKKFGQNPEIRRVTALLKKWATAGAHRIDRDKDGRYDDAEAIKIMDAWWPGMVSAMFKPVMGAPLLDQLRQTHEIDNAPNNHGGHLGSAYQTGFYGYVKKDLQRVLKVKVKQRYARALRPRQQEPPSQRADRLPPGGDRAVARAGLSGRRQVQDPRRPVLPRHGQLPRAGRDHAAADPLDQPAHLPAGAGDPGPPLAPEEGRPVRAPLLCGDGC